MKLVVVDHLPCLNNELGICTGMSDQGVSDFGRSLAHHVKLPKEKYGTPSGILTSTLARAIETVRLCFDRWQVPIVIDGRLAAIDYGDCHGSSMTEIQAAQDCHIYQRYPSGESYADMAGRHKLFLDEIEPRFANASVVLIGHYGTREILRHLVFDIPLDESFHQRAAARPKTQACGVEARKAIIRERVARAEYAEFEYVSGNDTQRARQGAA